MNDKARTARQTLKARRTETRSARRAHTLASHCLRAGLDKATASSVAGALRAKGKAIGVTGRAQRLFRRLANGAKVWRTPVRNGRRYTFAEFLRLATAYNPRAPRLVAARATLLAA